jgi:peptidoglycan/LPS O-acetylase OafA/YrhL
MVVGFHYLVMGPFLKLYPSPAASVTEVARYGYYGVPLFFMISGFVISMSAHGTTARKFLGARFTRLYPVFWAACSLTFIGVHAFGPQMLAVKPTAYLSSMTMLAPFITKQTFVDGVYWTLVVEWQFYFGVAALLVTRQFDRYRDWYFLAWLIVAEALLISQGHRTAVSLSAAEYAPYFVAGSAFYSWYSKTATRLTAANLLASGLVSITASASRILDVIQWNHYQLNLPVVVALTAFFYVLFALLCTGKLDRLSHPALPRLGALTYSLYLVHQNLGYSVIAATQRHLGLPAAIVLAGTLAILMAHALNRFVERPVQRYYLKRRVVPTNKVQRYPRSLYIGGQPPKDTHEKANDVLPSSERHRRTGAHP